MSSFRRFKLIGCACLVGLVSNLVLPTQSLADSTMETSCASKPPADAHTLKEGKNSPASLQVETNSLPKLILKPGQPIIAGMQAEDIVVTDNVALAREQVSAFPDSPEASFVLAVALTRTSMVEESLKEVRRARQLADKQGGPAYFDHMIATYEAMLQDYPKDTRVHYGLAWAYYMKAYVLAKYAKLNVSQTSTKQDFNQAKPVDHNASRTPDQTVEQTQTASPTKTASQTQVKQDWRENWVNKLADNTNADEKKIDSSSSALPLSGHFANLVPSMIPPIKDCYERAIKHLDAVLVVNPTDVWSKVYRAFLKAEYTGDLQSAMKTWQDCELVDPLNPAPYFFLGEGYLKQGNLKECLQNVSKAVALRAIGK